MRKPNELPENILKQKWYCLTLKVQARNESVLVSIHDLPAVIASLGVGIFSNAKAVPVLTVASGPMLTTKGVGLGPNYFVVSIDQAWY
ncbi:MAG: hypothetical protein D6772_14885 [Bacteroidetes bacterium]|nr:MAG: hypothetical protein D6772_14885 [Bacteroidota bacterium]